jgi:hypothetical protein
MSNKFDGDLQHPHPERIEEARERCNLLHLVIGEHRNFPGEFRATCAVNYEYTRGSGAGSHCGILTKHPGDGCPVRTGDKTEMTERGLFYKGLVIDSFNNEHYSAVRWWGKPDPEEIK